MFDVGLMELALIAFVAIIAFGPDRLPVLAKQAGVMIRKAKAMANSARDELREELGPDYADLQLRDLDPRNIVRRHIIEAMEDPDPGPPTGGAVLLEGQLPPYDVDAT
ncbi:sec-independent translocase [Nocardioides piscis]|uniref:Twin-arginine translocase subunit TatB n=1 Tax=Nocardioides piscis TaxID=2714938 RepID=A0A6G7YFW4_9ACTN|nr:sec-independent translocase [Nocardioides piscis]QIK75619.1 twin-arginine translocase subunit TatB [Nocardioides piscis]